METQTIDEGKGSPDTLRDLADDRLLKMQATPVQKSDEGKGQLHDEAGVFIPMSDERLSRVVTIWELVTGERFNFPVRFSRLKDINQPRFDEGKGSPNIVPDLADERPLKMQRTSPSTAFPSETMETQTIDEEKGSPDTLPDPADERPLKIQATSVQKSNEGKGQLHDKAGVCIPMSDKRMAQLVKLRETMRERDLLVLEGLEYHKKFVARYRIPDNPDDIPARVYRLMNIGDQPRFNWKITSLEDPYEGVDLTETLCKDGKEFTLVIEGGDRKWFSQSNWDYWWMNVLIGGRCANCNRSERCLDCPRLTVVGCYALDLAPSRSFNDSLRQRNSNPRYKTLPDLKRRVDIMCKVAIEKYNESSSEGYEFDEVVTVETSPFVLKVTFKAKNTSGRVEHFHTAGMFRCGRLELHGCRIDILETRFLYGPMD